MSPPELDLSTATLEQLRAASPEAPQTAPPPPPTAPKPPPWRRFINFPNLLTLTYFTTLAILISNHGLWRDEAQAFLIARDSSSFPELFRNLQYEGHPPLWHILLFLLTRLTTAPAAMQILHLLLATTTVYLVARFAPFPMIAKILFAFSYFQLFEYGIISRNYQLFVLLSIAIVALWRQRPTAFIRLGILIALLALTHVLGVILAAALGVLIYADSLYTSSGRKNIRNHPFSFSLGLLLAALGAYTSCKLLPPPPDGTYQADWNRDWSLLKIQETLSGLSLAYLPIPSNEPHFWNHILIMSGSQDAQYTGAKWGIICALTVLVLIVHSSRATLVFLTATLGILVFEHIKPSDSMRHHGPFFVAFIVAVWVAWINSPSPLPFGSMRWPRFILWLIPRVVFISLLSIQAYAAYIACSRTWSTEFSPARTAARALAPQLRPDDLLMADSPQLASSITAYLPGHQLFFPTQNRWGTFAIWKRFPSRAPGGINGAQQLARTTHQSVVLITPTLTPNLPPGVTSLGYFPLGVEEDERYGLYRIAAPPK